MIVNYCDLCGVPLKEHNFFTLYISEPHELDARDLDTEAYYQYVKQVQKDVKEICPACKHVFDKMFELRLSRLSELAIELNSMYNLPAKKNLKDRKNGKEKK